MTHALAIEGLVVDRRPQGIDFVLDQDRFEVSFAAPVALVGPSGCGKSTLLDVLALILRPSLLAAYRLAAKGGAVTDIAAVCLRGSADALAGWRSRRIGYVMQTGGLLPFATVGENIELPRRVLGLAATQGVQAIAERLGILPLMSRWPEDLSVGQRQRVAVARALAHEPVLLIADEPTASLDPRAADATMALLIETCRAGGAALLIATHDHDRASQFGFTTMAFAEAAGRARFVPQQAA